MKLSSMVFVLLVVAVLATSAMATTQTFSKSFPAGWSLITVPGIPLNPDPANIFGATPIDGNLYKWDAPTQGLVGYDMFDPGVFGNVLLTDGYWLRTSATANVSFSGLNDNETMDIWVSLPTKGWTLIGDPYNHDFLWESAKVTDGNTTKTLADASQHGSNWMSSIAFGWNASEQGLYDVGIEMLDFPTDTMLRPWNGYWVQSNVDKLALILEAS